MREMMQWQVHFLCLWLCASLPHYLILFCGAQFSIAVRRSFGLSRMLFYSRLRIVRQDANHKFKISRATHAISKQSAQDGIKESRGLCQVLKTVSEKIGLNSDSMAEVDMRPSMQRRPARCGSGTRVSSPSHSFK